MEHDRSAGQRRARCEPDDRPPVALTAGMGFQFAVLTIASIVLVPAVIVRAAGGSESYLRWAVFAASLLAQRTRGSGSSESYLTWAVFTAAVVSGVSTVFAGGPARARRCRVRALDGGLRVCS